MKKRIIIAAAFTACLALCAAMWSQAETIEETPALPQTPAVSAPEATVVELETEAETALPSEKEKAAIPQPEQTQEVVTEPKSAPAETPAVQPAPEQAAEPPVAKTTIEPPSGDMVYVEGFGWIESQGPNHAEYAEDMFTQLALVNKTAVNKLEEFENLISQRPELLQKCIIFVQTMEYGAKLQEILVRYSDKYHTYYADDEKINLENFAAGKIDCLLTCKKVSEGIDISSVTNIILFSSDRSRLVTTQRIGRALRLDKNNPEKKATVVDFVIEDSEENDNNADADRAEWLTDLSQTRRCEHEK